MEPGDIADPDAAIGLGEQLLEPGLTGPDDEVRGGDGGLGPVAGTAGAGGRLGLSAAGGVGVVEVGLQTTALDQRGSAPGQALAIDRGGGEPSGSRPSS